MKSYQFPKCKILKYDHSVKGTRMLEENLIALQKL